MRTFYSALLYLLLPVILLRLLWRSLKAPAYRQRWSERLAIFPQTTVKTDIWFHAVSVGEAEALFPLLRQLQQHQPDLRLLVTTTTPTGSARVKAVMGEAVSHVYLPYDLPDGVARFLTHFKPTLAVVVETEIWPNLFAACGRRGIPLFIINARLSEKSARGYQKLPALVMPALAQVQMIAAQTHDDAQRYIRIGARPDKVQSLGNIKFDIDIPPQQIQQGQQLKAQTFAGRFVWLCASTHADEELLLLQVYQRIKAQIPHLLLVLVPRHPERFPDVKKITEQQSLNIVLRTANQACTAATDVYLADTMGELKMLYAACDVALVGGSLVPKGGHNILEALAVGVPVLFGPFMNNFKDIAHGALQAQAALQCQTDTDIAEAVNRLYQQDGLRLQMVDQGKMFLQSNRGALARVCTLLEQALTSHH
ncbi:lipid IV(A) 3-deoxy-D-manno-octulosonic acid transferase [Methylosoma difficile]